MSTCLCMQCSKESPSPAEILFSFIKIACICILSIAFGRSFAGNGEHLQLGAVALFVAAYTCLYLDMYAGWVPQQSVLLVLSH